MSFAASSQRFDPYKNFKFRLMVDGKHVFGGNSAHSSQIPQLTVAEYRQGGETTFPVKSPGRSKYEAITLTRGVTHDPSFNAWAQQVSHFASNAGAQVPGKSFRKDVYLEIYNEAGSSVITYRFSNCWISHYKALPDVSGKPNAVAIEHITIENEGSLMVGLHHH